MTGRECYNRKMLISIIGNDFKNKQKKTQEVLAGLKMKRPDAIFSHMDAFDLNEQKFSEALATIGGLFEEKNIF